MFKEISIDQIASSDSKDPGITFSIRLTLPTIQAVPQLQTTSPTGGAKPAAASDTGI